MPSAGQDAGAASAPNEATNAERVQSPSRLWPGGLSDLARGRGHAPGFADVAIAATARRHDLTMLSRNRRHFATMDIAVIDPYEQLPPPGAAAGRRRPAPQ